MVTWTAHDNITKLFLAFMSTDVKNVYSIYYDMQCVPRQAGSPPLSRLNCSAFIQH